MRSEGQKNPIELRSVTKIYRTSIFKNKTAVNDVSLNISAGEVVGLLGANGSGKSTTIKMILGFLYPSSGGINVCGHPAGSLAARKLIGYLPENPRFQKFLTASEVMTYCGNLLGLRKPENRERGQELLRLVGLSRAAEERVGTFSKGMTQRLAIAQSLLNRPKLLIFDEPMSGLDPLGRDEIRKLIARIHDEMPDATLLFSSHVLADVEELCTSVAVLKHGKLERFGKTEDLMRSDGGEYYVTLGNLSASARRRYLADWRGQVHPLGVSFFVDSTDSLIRCLQSLGDSGAILLSLSSLRKKLERALFTESEERVTP